MTSLITNSSSMNALQALKDINANLEKTQNAISTGKSVTSSKDNAAYFQISTTMTGDRAATNSINEGLTQAKNSVQTASLGAQTIKDLATTFLEKVAFAQGARNGETEIEGDLTELVKQMKTTLSQSTFNGDDMLAAGGTAATDGAIDGATGVLTRSGATTEAAGEAAVGTTRNVVTGVTRAGGTYATTSIEVGTYDMQQLVADFEAIATGFATNAADGDTGEAFLAGALAATESVFADVTDIATKLGQSEKSITGQQDFLTKFSDNLKTGIGAMVDADMEEEAAKLKAYQTQQQLAVQSLSIANSAPQNIMSLFQ